MFARFRSLFFKAKLTDSESVEVESGDLKDQINKSNERTPFAHNCSLVSEDVCNAAIPTTSLNQSTDSEPSVNNDMEKIVVKPSGNNNLACTAISQKLNEIAEVAESLDDTIRDVQSRVNEALINDDTLDSATSSISEKARLEILRSTSSEDWHSRSTEDESFATASEGNFTPYSHSSSFQTASGRTSSHISSSKNSFDASEFPELAGSEHSFLSAQSVRLPVNVAETEQKSVTPLEDVHSESVTPTPDDHPNTGVESASYIADAPSLEILTEYAPPILSVEPEVSLCSSGNANSLHVQTPPNTHKPNTAWRRSKYYENITKQTIKGFL